MSRMLTDPELDHCLLRRFQVSCFVEIALGYVHTNSLLVVSCPISSCNQRLHDGLSMSTNNCMRYMDFDGMPRQQWYEWGLMPQRFPTREQTLHCMFYPRQERANTTSLQRFIWSLSKHLTSTANSVSITVLSRNAPRRCILHAILYIAALTSIMAMGKITMTTL